jgi:polyisoprenoid-binding protein YceI
MSAQLATLPETRTWTLDASHSTVAFRITHNGVSDYRGKFSEFDASYDAEAGRLSGSVEAASIDTFESLDELLRSPDYFDAQAHPQITFESTSIDLDGDVHTVVGDITLKGVTKSVTLTGTLRGTSTHPGWGDGATEHIGIELQTTIDRRDFNIDKVTELVSDDLNIGWDVTLEFSLELSAPVE